MAVIGAACRPGTPVLDAGARPAGVGGTLSGTARAAGDRAPLAGRTVTAVNVQTGERLKTETNADGHYTMMVPVGTYRLEIQLGTGETLVAGPSEDRVDAGDLDEGRDFSIGRTPPR
jgi:hypothetical protein